MPIAEDPDPRPSEEPEPTVADPFDGLVLDEDFVRGADVKEPAARTRILAARWRLEPPVDPGGRRWSLDAPGPTRPRTKRAGFASKLGSGVLIAVAVAATVVAIGIGPGSGLLSLGDSPQDVLPSHAPGSPRPSTDVALSGGGTSDGSKCGMRGFHRFAQTVTSAPAGPAAIAFVDGRSDTPPAGPQLALGSYGFSQDSPGDPGHFTIDLLLGPGASRSLELSPPLGPQGVAVEIEGPDGLVGGAYDLPVKLGDGTAHTPQGKINIGSPDGATAEVTLPAQALCPGIDALAVQQRLSPPIDSTNTITGPAPYTLTVSLADPAVGALRRATRSPLQGDVLSATNQLPQ
ncbi:hypothetical protein ABH930_006922 [Kitasatospora sp. GAS204A]|uniref:SCO2583/SCO2584 N-terminal domain-containing protein n=1 Tax=unclassified Kitasatospora TaxID=2633591 RepID=UPI0024753C06|nr:hypothetical protein [Kitasatospora sp. GAS204B]MDH6121415.1 hypothetical protein [Kitasatospora sp. GAS204B]